jgi:hypothetical protein
MGSGPWGVFSGGRKAGCGKNLENAGDRSFFLALKVVFLGV